MKNNSFWVSFFSLVIMLLFLGFGGKGVYYSVEKLYKHTSLVFGVGFSIYGFPHLLYYVCR
ncbi:Uncharacterised protein [Chryseobacterium nakagawai]|nr:Uncharacterised protein [Chryseobacterium nakagawai]